MIDDFRAWISLKTGQYLKTAGYLIDPQTGDVFALAPSGVIEVAELIRLIGGNFESGDLLAHQWDVAVVAAGTATQVEGELVLSTGTTADGAALVDTGDRAEFTTGTFNKAHMAVQTDFTAANCISQWGVFDPVIQVISGDGVFFRNTSGTITLVRRKGGADVEEINSTQFVNQLQDGNRIHTYEIVYNAGSALFYQNRILIYKMVYVTEVGYETVHLKLGITIENINGNIVNNTIKTRGFSCSRVGTESAEPDSFVIDDTLGSGTIKNTIGTLIKLIVVDTGAGQASINIYDSITPTGTPIFSLDLTDFANDLEMDLKFQMGLSFDTTGAGFQLIAVYK